MVEEEHAGLLGGPATSPSPGSLRWRQSREENRKWETAAAEERGAGMEDRMEGRAATSQEADGPMDRLGDQYRPPPLPPAREPTRRGPKTGLGELPSRSHQAKARSREGRRGGVVWVPRPPPPARGGSCCPQGPAALEPLGAREYVGRT